MKKTIAALILAALVSFPGSMAWAAATKTFTNTFTRTATATPSPTPTPLPLELRPFTIVTAKTALAPLVFPITIYVPISGKIVITSYDSKRKCYLGHLAGKDISFEMVELFPIRDAVEASSETDIISKP